MRACSEKQVYFPSNVLRPQVNIVFGFNFWHTMKGMGLKIKMASCLPAVAVEFCPFIAQHVPSFHILTNVRNNLLSKNWWKET